MNIVPFVTNKSKCQNSIKNFNQQQFACGRYVTETRIPDDKGRWSSFDVVGEEIYLQGRQLLEEEHSGMKIKTRNIFVSYVNEFQNVAIMLHLIFI